MKLLVGSAAVIAVLSISLYIKNKEIETLQAQNAFISQENSKLNAAYLEMAKSYEEIQVNRDKINQKLLMATKNASSKFQSVDTTLSCENRLMEFLKISNN